MTRRARKRILDFLYEHANASTGQIARGLGMKPAAIRHHLAILREDGRIEEAGATDRLRRGRPEKIYRTANRAHRENVGMIASTLLTGLAPGSSAPRRADIISLLVQGLLRQLGAEGEELPRSPKMDLLVSRLNALGYASQWEAGAEGPRVSFSSCPYAEIIKEHPELCQMDARAVSKFSGKQARQLAKMDPESRTPPRCIFSLR